MSEVNMNMFRAYDVRGIFGEDLTVEVMLNIGRAFGTYMKRHDVTKVTVGGDVRASTNLLENALVAGICAIGLDIELVEQSPLGVTLFNSFHKSYGASAFITASHLPPEWNGVKFYWGEGIGFSPEQNQEVTKIFTDRDFDEVKAFDVGKIKVVDPFPEFIEYLKNKFNFSRTFKIAIDSGNGATSLVVPELFKALGFEVITLFAEPDPRFPNRPSEPNEETLSQLADLVKSEDVDFGAGFDGDGDRCVFVDENGKVISSDAAGVLIAEYLLETGDNNRVLINMECSIAMENYLKEIGAEITRIRVGHSFLSLEGKKLDAVWGVEASGHAIAPKIFLFDDALILPLLMASALDHFGKTVSELCERVTLPVKKRFDLKCSDDAKFKVVEELTTFFKSEEGETNDLDGVALTTDNGRILVRASNTSPKVRATIESMTQEGFDALEAKYLDKIKSFIPS